MRCPDITSQDGVGQDVDTGAIAAALAALLGSDAADVLVTNAAAALSCAAPPAPPPSSPLAPATRRLLQAGAQQPSATPPAPPVTPPITTAIAISVVTRVGVPPSASDVATALGTLTTSNVAGTAMLLDALQRAGAANASTVRLAPSTGGVIVTAAPAPPPPPPPDAPVAAPAARRLGSRLLPLRIVVSVVLGVLFCCCLPCLLLALAGWKAAVNTVTLIGVRGTFAGGPLRDFFEVALDGEGGDEDAASTKGQQEPAATPLTPASSSRAAAAAALGASVTRYFNRALDANTVLTLRVSSLRPAEVALRAPLLWGERTQDGISTTTGPLPCIPEDELTVGTAVEAVFEMHTVFRSPQLAWRWRALLDGDASSCDCGAATSDGETNLKDDKAVGMAARLAAALQDECRGVIASPRVAIVLLRHTSDAHAAPQAAAAGMLYGAGEPPFGAVQRRTTLYTHSLQRR